MQSRNAREGNYRGRTPAAEGAASRRHVRSRGARARPVSTGASLALLRRLIRRPPQRGSRLA